VTRRMVWRDPDGAVICEPFLAMDDQGRLWSGYSIGNTTFFAQRSTDHTYPTLTTIGRMCRQSLVRSRARRSSRWWQR
jgi:hypothetical protein